MQTISIKIIQLYQLTLGPVMRAILRTTLGVESTCRFTPSCSQYTINQIQEHGTISGLWKGWQQFKRCW